MSLKRIAVKLHGEWLSLKTSSVDKRLADHVNSWARGGLRTRWEIAVAHACARYTTGDVVAACLRLKDGKGLLDFMDEENTRSVTRPAPNVRVATH